MNADRRPLALAAARTGTDEDGLYSFGLNPETGSLDRRSSIPAGEGPKFLAVHPDGRHCYAVDTTGGGSVAAVEIDPGTGALTPLNRVPNGDDGPGGGFGEPG